MRVLNLRSQHSSTHQYRNRILAFATKVREWEVTVDREEGKMLGIDVETRESDLKQSWAVRSNWKSNPDDICPPKVVIS